MAFRTCISLTWRATGALVFVLGLFLMIIFGALAVNEIRRLYPRLIQTSQTENEVCPPSPPASTSAPSQDALPC